MLGLVHPLLLWGLAAVAVPVLIHLLLRQRPRPRPWAAMRWLRAAAQAATRRWKLTNWLLLALRCLLVALVALAIARPTLGSAGDGERLVLVIDRSASMGPRGDDPGPLAAAQAALASAPLAYARIALVAVDARAELVAEGEPVRVREALARLAASALPGGLDQAGADGGAVAAACDPASDVLLVSDFQQDRGDLLAGALVGRCRRLGRWAVGRPQANAQVAGLDALPDPVAGQASELVLRLAGPVRSAALAVDDGPFLAAAGAAAEGRLRLAVPPLATGAHRLRVRIEDDSLAYDNLAEIPCAVRPPVPVLAVRAQGDWLSAALASAVEEVACRAVEPARLAGEGLPDGGLVALREAAGDGARLAAWVRGGGVLWATWPLVARDAALAVLVEGVTVEGGRAGGRYASGQVDLDEALGLAAVPGPVPAVRLPPGAEVLLAAGGAPLVVALPAGRGRLVLELAPLADDPVLLARGTLPLWALRCVRRLTAATRAPRQIEAGLPAPEALVLRRGGRLLSLATSEPAQLDPGIWDSDAGPVLVLPSREEGRIDQASPVGAVRDLARALPGAGGRELAPWLLLAALAVALAEGLLAAWAGRAYGR